MNSNDENHSQSNNSKFNQDIDKELNTHIDQLEIKPNQFSTPQNQRESIKHEIQEAIQLKDLSKQIESALTILADEGANYLSDENYVQLMSDIERAAKLFATMDLEASDADNLQTISQLSDTSLKAIVDIATAKFKDQSYEASLSLFTLLTLLNPSYSEYWFRLGISAQLTQDFELATGAYEAALQLDPNLIGARLFAAECFFEQGLIDEAKYQLAEAKNTIHNTQVDSLWLEMVPSVEQLLSSTH